MEHALSLNIGSVGGLSGLENAEERGFPIDADAGRESTPARRHAEKATLVVALCAAQVLFIDARRNVAEITKGVVALITVAMIHLAHWPFTGHVKDS